MKVNICTCVNKIDWIFLNGPVYLGPPPKRNSFHFARDEK